MHSARTVVGLAACSLLVTACVSPGPKSAQSPSTPGTEIYAHRAAAFDELNGKTPPPVAAPAPAAPQAVSSAAAPSPAANPAPSVSVLQTGGIVPDWVKTAGRAGEFPVATYLTGFGASAADRSVPLADKVAAARKMACANLAQAIQVNISSEQLVNQFSSMARGHEQLVDEFKSTVVAKSDLRLDGIEFKDYGSGRNSDPAYSLAYLNRAEGAQHYVQKLGGRMKMLRELNDKAGQQLSANDRNGARATYLASDKVISEAEEIIMILELLNPAVAIPDSDLKAIVDMKSGYVKVWNDEAQTMDEAAEQLAMKLGLQQPPAGKVQVNTFSLGDTCQYSQFSGNLRPLVENYLKSRTPLRPLLVGEMDFTPENTSVMRQRVAANGAEFLLSGTYDIKDATVDLYARLSRVDTGEIIAAASARMDKRAAGKLELQPRNFLQALQDQHVFSKDEIVGGALNLETWSNRGADGLALENGDKFQIYVRVNKPAYIRFLYHLCNGARIVPDPTLMNYYIDEKLVNRVVTLPTSFEVCAPYGSETMQIFASTEELPPVSTIKKNFDGEAYEVIADSLAQSNVKYRGIRKAKSEVEVAERRITLTTMDKVQTAARGR